MDMDGLMTQKGMRVFTDEQVDNWTTDSTQMEQMARIIEARLANTHIDGDKNAGQARRRARKVARRMKKAAALLARAAAEIEAGNAVYVREVIELPERRAAELERSEARKNRLGLAAGVQEAVAGSLQKSATGFNGTTPVGNPQVNGVQPGPQYVTPYPQQFAQPTGAQQPLPNMADLFQDFPEAL